MDAEVDGRILLVEDSEDVCQLHCAILAGAGFDTASAATLAEANALISEQTFDAVVIDLRLPDGNGMSLIPPLREQGNTGVIIVTSSNDVRDRLEGLEKGADDFLEKPVHPRELVARIHNLLVRLRQLKAQPEPTYFSFENWSIDFIGRHVDFKSGAREKLTDSEFRIMEILVRNAGMPVHRDRILGVFNETEETSSRAVDKAIYRTRLKFQTHLGTAAKVIETVHGFGYRLVSKDA